MLPRVQAGHLVLVTSLRVWLPHLHQHARQPPFRSEGGYPGSSSCLRLFVYRRDVGCRLRGGSRRPVRVALFTQRPTAVFIAIEPIDGERRQLSSRRGAVSTLLSVTL
jgi:hypothetical protein